MDNSTGFCKGCFRTLEEIGRWALMSVDERHQHIAALTKRRKDLGADDIETIRLRLRQERRKNRRRRQKQAP